MNGSEANWDLQRLRLPRLVEEDPAGPGMLVRMAVSAKPVWPTGRLKVPSGALLEGLTATLRIAIRQGQLVQGLESAQRRLAAERRGLSIADRRSGVTRGERVSRLVLCSNDGADRFYRQVERLLQENSLRVVAVILDVDATQMGQRVLGDGQMARLLMLHHKRAVAKALLDLFPPVDP